MTKDELREYLRQHQDATELDLSEKGISPNCPRRSATWPTCRHLTSRRNQLTALPPEIGQPGQPADT